ncbi:FAD/NAD(P)-binding domain-containing protein [Xylaria cf. heliscus]|nr:FAD/NAD(P)-binding domain-containing protein [Xylaria cf. heliscus]
MNTHTAQSSSPAANLSSAFSETHWRALLALLDAVIPSVIQDEAPSVGPNQFAVPSHELRGLYQKALCGAQTRFCFEEFCHYMALRPSDDPKSIANHWVLDPLLRAVLRVRTSILRSWQPILARIFITVGKTCWSQTNQQFLQLNDYRGYGDETAPRPSFNFNFIQFSESVKPAIIQTNVVIVGSGCGGAVCAKVLAEAGLRVLVVDRGYYFPPHKFPLPLDEVDNIFQGGGLVSVDGSTLVTAGQCWGGGGTVNWSASLQTPSNIRKEWAQGGLTFFGSNEFQESLGRVCSAMVVGEAIIQGNHSNDVLLEGSRKLGWQAAICPQNTGGGVHHCGSSCGLGCRTGKKQGPSAYWLPAAGRGGAQFIEGFEVSQILFAYRGSSKATGLMGKWTSRNKHNNTVIIAARALNTPLLMMRSGIKNSSIGKNLYLHPVANVVATWEKEVKRWEGEILTSVVTEFEDLDKARHGVKIESLAMQPYVAMLLHPWQSGLDFKTAALQYRHMTCHMALCRDRDAGSVSPEPTDGSPVINYTTSKFDRAHIRTGLVAIAKLCYIQGASGLAPAVPNTPYFGCLRPVQERRIDDPDFVTWFRILERTGLDPLNTTFNSAHQMGTARMGIKAETSVVNRDGRVWGCDNLYIADTSVFRSACGVNPMITVIAIADHIAGGIAARSVQEGY